MKVLVISHNPLCSYNGMGKTLSSLLSCFRREELCQLYIYPSYPDQALCASYYRVTDKDVLKSLPVLRTPGGEVAQELIRPDQSYYEDSRDEALYRMPKNKSPLRRLARDSIWRLSRWYGKELRAWLAREAPDRILVAPGPAKFLYDLALDISENLDIPIAVYLCDEYYFVRPERSLLGKLQQRLLNRKMETLMARSALLITICEELKTAYGSRFSVPAHVVMTGSMLNAPAQTPPTAQRISYFGNLRCGRYLSLAQIGRALDEVNRIQGVDYKLDVYTAEKNKDILGPFSGVRSIQIHPFLLGAQYRSMLIDSELLLHVEGFDEKSKDRVRHSISTKIADSLASGIPLLAFGPRGIASMEYLRRNECAFVCSDPAELPKTLHHAMEDPEARRHVAGTALRTAKEYHDAEKNSRTVYSLLSNMGGSPA